MGGDDDQSYNQLRNQSAVSADYESSIPLESRLQDAVSQLSGGNQFDENTKRQIQMLEELARQMREEKE